MPPVLINATEHPDACGRHNACRCQVGDSVQVLIFGGLLDDALGGGQIRIPCWVKITAVDRPPLPAAPVSGDEPTERQTQRIRYTGTPDPDDFGAGYLPEGPLVFYPDNVFQVG